MGKILIPQEVTDREEREAKAQRDAAAAAVIAERRAELREGLAAFKEIADRFPQTTHGVIYTGPVPIETIARCLQEAYERPNAFNLSNLSQYLGHFLKGAE